jgi:CubicO group peptidase (beta-lactamase class C family)
LFLIRGGIFSQEDLKLVWPNDDWVRSKPESQNLDSQKLNLLISQIQEGTRFPDLHSLIIVRHGFLVVEEYFKGYKANKMHTLQSVSKSFTSALVGIAIHLGQIKGVKERLLEFFKDKKSIKHLNQWKKEITLQDLLTMRSGTDYHERYRGAPHFQLNKLDSGWDDFYLNRPMQNQPGTQFQYDSGAVIITSSVLQRCSSLHADDYAQKYLFPHIGIKQFNWFKNKEGHPHTGGGLHLLPLDMARFGLLYLRKGDWKGKQVVPSKWVGESFKKRVNLDHRGRNHVIGYGYWWWILEPDPQGEKKDNIFAAMGFMAQYIFVIPEHDMVVVVTGGTHSGRDQRKPIEFLYSHILPSVKRGQNR